MRILPVQNQKAIKPNFRGYFVDDFGYQDQHLKTAKNSGRRMEETIGTFHPYWTKKIYYADPLEQVSDFIKERADYIVYDDEPALFDVDNKVSKMYFFPSEQSAHDEYLDNLKKSREYFYRIEMMDQKAVKGYANDAEKVAYFQAHIKDAQYNQETIATAENIFKEALPKIQEKNHYYFRAGIIEGDIQNRTAEISKAEHELKQREEMQAILKSKVDNLEAKKSEYEALLQVLEKDETINSSGIRTSKENYDYNYKNHILYNNYTENLSKPVSIEHYNKYNRQFKKDLEIEKEELNIIKSQFERVKTQLNKYKEFLKQNDLILQKVGQYKNELPAIIEGLKQELARKTALFEKAKSELIPKFEHLKNYLLSRGIRTIK